MEQELGGERHEGALRRETTVGRRESNPLPAVPRCPTGSPACRSVGLSEQDQGP